MGQTLRVNANGESVSQYMIEDTIRAIRVDLDQQATDLRAPSAILNALSDEANRLVGTTLLGRITFMETRYGRVRFHEDNDLPHGVVVFFAGPKPVATIANLSTDAGHLVASTGPSYDYADADDDIPDDLSGYAEGGWSPGDPVPWGHANPWVADTEE